ncbi:hypothetical protein [uncultured Erythrobacter sp.]|uniref:hypothetical protein n=1 Tax=uncultured Erythrobacter sp. TaxID=263913 RepID=UPI002607C99D|nr:hypothetical protein [uncultured Erythrobacter sp.]
MRNKFALKIGRDGVAAQLLVGDGLELQQRVVLIGRRPFISNRAGRLASSGAKVDKVGDAAVLWR